MSITIVPSDLPPRDAYRLMISILVPRPIAWLSTCGSDGSLNLAPFSFFNGVGGTPPTIMVSIGQRQGRPKDSLRNIQETGDFVVNIVGAELAESMNLSSGEYAYDVDEFDLTRLDTLPSLDVTPPRVALAPAAMEVKATQFVPIDGTSYTLVIGQILRYHLRDGILRPDGLVDVHKLNPLARLGGDEYALLERVFEMKRPIVAE
jgi:flavin reductase (DIM6/NTAB) family NADH-FMN oxidoreductase RutF